MHAVVLMFMCQIFGLAFAVPVFGEHTQPFSSPQFPLAPFLISENILLLSVILFGFKDIKEIRNLS